MKECKLTVRCETDIGEKYKNYARLSDNTFGEFLDELIRVYESTEKGKCLSSVFEKLNSV